MGKAFAGFIRVLVILALAGGVAYNYYEISRLRAEVASLRAGTHSKTPVAVPVKSAPDSAGVTGAMAGAQQHAERAQEFLRKQDYGAAKRELEQAATSMRQAGSDARNQTAQTIDQLRRTVSDLSEKAEALTGSAKRVTAGKQSEKTETNGATD